MFQLETFIVLFQIVFLTTKRKYDEVNRRNCIPNRKFKILLEDESVEDAYEALLEHRCRTCDAGPLFKSFDALKSHMSRTHTLFPCDLCVNHLKVHSDAQTKGSEFYTNYSNYMSCNVAACKYFLILTVTCLLFLGWQRNWKQVLFQLPLKSVE